MNQKSNWCMFQSSDVETIRKYKSGGITKDDIEEMGELKDIDSSSDDDQQSDSCSEDFDIHM
jgi:hypothetical protein